ncbi:MAG: hypothetical protein HYW07_23970 [Candidatus Latescibacteria bacterium]|nr:hypothetical protein [Candidatus Latescibacterota bacterium]
MPKNSSLLLAALAILLLPALAAWAEEVRTEEQVPLDPEGKVQEITPALRTRLGLFPEIGDFQSARLFLGQDQVYVLEIAWQRQGKRWRQRQLLSPAAVDSLRLDLRRRLTLPPAGLQLDHSGRGELILDQILLSLLAYGPAMNVMLDLDSARPALASHMLTTATSFYLPYRLTQHRSVTPAHRQLAQFGGTRGIAYGLIFADLLFEKDRTSRSDGATVLSSAALGSALGFKGVDWRGSTHGQAEVWAVMGDFGLLGGLGIAYTAGLYEKDRSRRWGDGMALLASGAGLYCGDWLGQHRDYTRGDAYVLRAGGFLGALLALPLVNATGIESGRAHVGGALAGMAAGVGLNDHLLKRQDFSFGQGLIVSGGELAGALLGLGLTYLADTGGHFDELAYFSSAALGGLGGFTLTFRAFSE